MVKRHSLFQLDFKADTQTTNQEVNQPIVESIKLSNKILSRWTNQQVFLNLFIKFIKSLLSVLHGGAGLMVALFPLLHVVLIQVLVSQSQCTEAFARILLF